MEMLNLIINEKVHKCKKNTDSPSYKFQMGKYGGVVANKQKNGGYHCTICGEKDIIKPSSKKSEGGKKK